MYCIVFKDNDNNNSPEPNSNVRWELCFQSAY